MGDEKREIVPSLSGNTPSSSFTGAVGLSSITHIVIIES